MPYAAACICYVCVFSVCYLSAVLSCAVSCFATAHHISQPLYMYFYNSLRVRIRATVFFDYLLSSSALCRLGLACMLPIRCCLVFLSPWGENGLVHNSHNSVLDNSQFLCFSYDITCRAWVYSSRCLSLLLLLFYTQSAE